MVIYIAICQFLMKHDRTMASMLPREAIKKRFRGNVIDLLGHMTTFLFQTAFTAWLVYCFTFIIHIKHSFHKVLLATLPVFVNYTFLGLLQLWILQPLRLEFFKLMQCIFPVKIILVLSRLFNFLGLFRGCYIKIVSMRRYF